MTITAKQTAESTVFWRNLGHRYGDGCKAAPLGVRPEGWAGAHAPGQTAAERGEVAPLDNSHRDAVEDEPDCEHLYKHPSRNDPQADICEDCGEEFPAADAFRYDFDND